MGVAVILQQPGTQDVDELAIQRVASGDPAALAELFDRHRSRLFVFLYRLVGDAPTAEDLLGETFLHLHRGAGQYHAGSGFAPWLFRIARNLAVSELRRRRVRQQGWQRLVAWFNPNSAAPEPEPCDISDRVQAALRKLSEEQRTAIVLKEYLELDYREVGRVLGCSEQAARARTYRARSALRALLEDWYAEGRAEI